MSKRPYRRYVTASSRPQEAPNRSVGLVCVCCGYTSAVTLTIASMTDLPKHCGQPMLISGSASAATVPRSSALLP